MSIQVEYATLAILGRFHKVLRSKLDTVISTRPTNTTGFMADLQGSGVAVHMPTATMRLSPAKDVLRDTENEDVVIMIYHNNDRSQGDRTTGGATFYREVNTKLTVGCLVRCLHASDEFGEGQSATREPPTNSGASMVSKEQSYYRAQLYVGAIEYALMKWGRGGSQFYDVRRARTEFGYEDDPQSLAFGRIEFEVTQDLEIPNNIHDLT